MCNLVKQSKAKRLKKNQESMTNDTLVLKKPKNGTKNLKGVCLLEGHEESN